MPSLELLEQVARGAHPPAIEPGDRERIAAARAVIDDALAQGTAVYGVTTGFGRLASVRIAAQDAAQLQLNLVRSHAVGAGPPLDGGRRARDAAAARRVAAARALRRAARVRRAARGAARARRRPGDPEQGLGRLLGRSRAARAPRARADRRGRGDCRRRAAAGRRGTRARRPAAAGAEREGGARADQRHPPDGGRRRARRARGRAAGRRGGGRRRALARGVQGLDGAVRRAAARAAPAAGPAGGRRAPPRAARGQPDRRQPRGLRSRAGPLHAALRAAGSGRRLRCGGLRRRRDRARARGGHRQPARVPGGRRRALGRQLPRSAAVAAARSPGAGDVRAGLVLRAPRLRVALARLRRPAGVPVAAPGAVVGPDDRPVRGSGPRQRVPGARASGRAPARSRRARARRTSTRWARWRR